MTTKAFLGHFGFEKLRDLPDLEMLEDAALLSKDKKLRVDEPEQFGAPPSPIARAFKPR